MKKILIILMMLLMLTACSSESESQTAAEKDIVNISEENINNMISTGLFDNCNDLDNELLEINRFKLDTFEDLIVSSSESAEDPSMYLIALPKEGKYNDCKAQIDYYVDGRLSAYLDYNPEAAKMIEDKLSADYGDYIIYIISNDNDKALTALTE